MDVVQRRAALYVLATVLVIGCGGKKKPARLVDIDEVSTWAKKNSCTSGATSADDVLPGAQFSCVKPLGECGCRAVVSAVSKSGNQHADTVQILVTNCRREVGSQAAKDIVVHLLSSLGGMDLDKPLHDDTGDAPKTAATVTRHYEDHDRPERDATIVWSRDVFADGKPQQTETYRIVFSIPHVSGDHKLSWSETPIVSKAPACASHAPTDEDMARVPAGPAIPVQLRCPPSGTAAASLPFEIDRHLVTCEQYRACVDAHACPEEPDSCVNAAVVSRSSADAYCKWRHAELPTIQEWELAVRGSEANAYPTGAQWDPVAGCRTPTMTGDPAGLQRCENTNVDGVTYYVLDRYGEWTSEDDCVASKEPTKRAPVAIMLGIEVLGRTAPVVDSGREQFRCARPHEAK